MLTLALFLSSWAVVQAGIFCGDHWVHAGAGLPEAYRVTTHDLFRFDSHHYKTIADEGYVYNGDPNSSPNIVFAPMFPLLLKLTGYAMPDDLPLAGLILNKILFFFGLLFMLEFLTKAIGVKRAFWSLFALGTAAGAYAFHAVYSESAMLFFLGLALISHQRRWRWTLAFAACALGASRLTAAPIALAFALLFLRAAWLNRKTRAHVMRDLSCAVISVAGVTGYFIYIWFHFGNPFVLLPEIQATSWGRFHPPADSLKLVTLGYFLEYWTGAFGRGFNVLDIKTINLIWTTLGLITTIYLFAAWRRGIFAFVFAMYFLFIYFTNISSDFLISAHRFFVLMVPLFVMFTGVHAWVEGKTSVIAGRVVGALLLTMNLAFGIFMASQFNQGIWFYF